MTLLLKYFVWNGDSEIFDLGFIAFRWYSLFFVTAFIVSYQILKHRLKQDIVPANFFLDKLILYVVLGTIVGARLGHCLFYDFGYYKHHLLEAILPFTLHPQFKVVGYQGLASHGGAIGILIAIVLFSRRNGVPFLWIVDRIVLVVPLVGSLIRCGNFMNSEIIGTPSSVPWAVVFQRIDNRPRHPAQLYEAGLYLIIFFILRYLDRRVIAREQGFLFGTFLTLLFSVRFIVEFWKENQIAFEDSLALNVGQMLSIPFIIVGLVLVFRKGNGLEGRQSRIMYVLNNKQ